ncbi:helix-turn-helix domain-containing protein [Algibacter sp. L1A34]|uniref:helix-turn-helix domain-containing protein n=1 Tax=Algibacter sp. L1A34 TaxID=2686365 RepID=UPI00131E4540|nr:helix-turn-helix domain-containing protein [Algibacter sp. L1A34]
MITKTIQIQDITFDELADAVAEKLMSKLKGYIDQKEIERDDDVYLTRKEVAEYLKISLTTVHHWTNNGILIASKIGNRVYFQKSVLKKSMYVTGKI